MENMLISVVLPTFNGEEFIKESIESILNQSYKNLELIIINDCSSDSTPEIIEKYAKLDSRVKIINNKTNQKLPKSLNIGFQAASGEFLTWSSDDNYYHKDALEKMVEYLGKNPKKALVCADYEVIEINGKIAKECVSGEVGELLERNCINCCFLYRACVASEVGGYNEAEFKVEDYDFWLRFGLVGKIGCINEVLYTYRKHNSSLSATQKWGEIYTKTENLLIKYLPLYLEKYPALKLGLGSRLRILLLKNDFKGILELFKDSSRDLRRKIYVFLKDRYLNLGDKNCVQIICSFGLKYRIKIYLVWLKNRWNLK